LISPDQPVLAETGGRVRFVGDAVAAVAAVNEAIARRALELIEVDYEPLPVVASAEEALLQGMPVIHPDAGSNLLHSAQLRHGDVEKGFDEADVIVEGEYTTPFIDHAYLQPEAGVARVDDEGRVAVWVGTQWAHEDRRQIANALALPEDRVRVIHMTTGGAFGGREDVSVQIVLTLMALETGETVKALYTRPESIMASTKRHPFRVRYRTGATKEGKLTAIEVDLLSNAGAYASTSLVVLNTALTLAAGPYEVPNARVDARTVYTNSPPGAAMRGFGANQVGFAAEMQMGKLAEKLGISGVELRRRNLYRSGSVMVTGQELPDAKGAVKTLDAAVETANRMGLRPGDARREGTRRRGVGVACGFKNVGYNLGWDDKATAIVERYRDHAVVKVGTSEVGQGSTTVLGQVAASALDLPRSDIEVIARDTAVVPNSGSCSASRSTFVVGNAILRAGTEARRRFQHLGPDPSDDALPVVVEHTYHAPATKPMDPETGQSDKPNFTYGYGAQAVEVDVDVETGEVRLLRCVAAHDVGQAVNPNAVEGQIEGGFVMGQGYGLLEEHKLAGGHPQSKTLATFLIPTIKDAPEQLVPVILEEADPDGPMGARGVGEMPMLPTPSAIAEAVHDALGIWIDDLPLTPERILRGLGVLEEEDEE
jgi:CO/xanthine dehydrogenase Mo-binding subunit